MAITVDELRQLIEGGLNCAHLEVDGDGEHFEAIIVSDEFDGLALLARHQRVYRALGEHMGGRIHALSMKTLTPAQWKNQS